MAILKIKKETNYVTMTNETAQRTDLSFGAKGLLIELLSYPEKWSVHKTNFYRDSDKRTAVDSLFKELKDAGYIEFIQIKNESGKIIDNEWVVYEKCRKSTGMTPKSVDSPTCGKNRLSEIQHLLKQQDIYKTNIKKNNTKKDLSVEKIIKAEKEKAKDLEFHIEEFNLFMSYYPKRIGSNSPQAAFRAWCNRLKEKYIPAQMIQGGIRYQRHCNAMDKTSTEFVMMAGTFLGRDKHFLEKWEISNGKPNNKSKSIAELSADFRTKHFVQPSA